MNTRTRRAASPAAITVVALLLALTGCVSSSSGSRATLYESIDDLARDSTAIVAGTVRGQRQEDHVVISTVEVSSAPTNPQLGADVDGEAAAVAAGDTIEVRQMDDAPSSGASMLKSGAEYLLFLTPSMLAGDAATQFYVTGAEAGIYVRDGTEFRRLVNDTGDTLPETITPIGQDVEQ